MTEKNEMNKQQALEKLAALEAETKALRAIIEAPEPAGSLLPSVKKSRFYYPDIVQAACMWFDEANQRDEYVKAFETLLDLRRQPGSEAPKEGVNQWSIGNTIAGIQAEVGGGFCVKIDRLAPCFATEEQAEAAIKTVGEEQIRHMFNTLHGVK